MRTTSHEPNAIYMKPELLAEARQAAEEEQRAADELVSDAVRRYLQQRNGGEALQPVRLKPSARYLICLNPFAALMWNSPEIPLPVGLLICEPVPSRYKYSLGNQQALAGTQCAAMAGNSRRSPDIY